MRGDGHYCRATSYRSPSAGPSRLKPAALLLCILLVSASSCFDDTSDTPSLAALSFVGSAVDAENTEPTEFSESAEIEDHPDITITGDTVESAPDPRGAITIDFNVPSMHNAKIYGFVFDSRGAFRGEIGYGTVTHLENGKHRSAVRHATSDYLNIYTGAAERFPGGTYTVHGKFDLNADGFDSAQGDKGFRADFTVNGDTTVPVRERDLVDPCAGTITSANRTDLRYATIYVYMYFPGGDPLRYYAYRYDGGTSFVKLNHYGNDLGNNMSRDLNSGVYDVLIIADMDDSIGDPEEPVLSNGDKFIVIKGMIIDGTGPIDISDYVFKTYITDILPAPEVRLEVHGNAIGIAITNIAGASSYNVYGRSVDGNALIAAIAGSSGDTVTSFTDYGPDNEYEAYGLPAAMNFYYRVAAVDGRGREGEAGPWAVVSSREVEAPVIFGDRTQGQGQVELAVSVPPYCREIEITARSGSCRGALIGTYSFPVSQEQRDRGIHFPLTELSLAEGTIYGFTVRGMDLYGEWSAPSPCYPYAY